MSRPVAAMNCWNSSTVTAFVDIASGRPMVTQCSGFSNGAAPLSVRADPCWNRPVGSTVMPGHVGQSCTTVPGFGTAGDEIAATGAGAWRAKNQTTAATMNTAALNPIARAIAPDFQAPPRSCAENSFTNCLTVGVRLRRSRCRPCTRAEYCADDSSARRGGGNFAGCAPAAESNGWVPVKSSYATHANA